MSTPTDLHAPTDPRVNHRLTDAELAALAHYGETRWHDAGDILIHAGDREFDLCVVISGQLDMYLDEKDGVKRVAWLEPRQFTGDVTNLTGGRSRAKARMAEAGEVLHVPFSALQRLLVENSLLSDLLVETFLARRAWQLSKGRASVLVIGCAFDRDSFAIRDLLIKHSVPHLFVDVDTDEGGDKILEKRGLTRADLPALITGSTSQLVRPTLSEVSAALGLDLLPDGACADVVVVGAGPAGLAAAVYAASEGLSVVAVDSSGPGGQAGSSSKIENYLGFPSGISGRDLAQRATVQAQKFGARFASPATAAKIEPLDGGAYCVRLEDGRMLKSRAVVVASGARYRRPPIEGLEVYEGRGVYYGATAMEAQLCSGARVCIVGAGNSAGQGAVYLAGTTEHVHVLFRRPNIRDTMSEYLVRRLEETSNISLHPSTEIAGFVARDGVLAAVNARSPEGELELETPFVFLFTGADPMSGWLPPEIARDEKGFLKTGVDIANLELVRARWALDRMPSFFETSWPRVYAVGDIRSGSVKRVASGVGEGSVVVQYIHRALAEPVLQAAE